MKLSRFNYIWPSDEPGKLILFNSLTTALVEISELYAGLLEQSIIDYDAITSFARLFLDGLKQGGFVLEDEIDELKILQYNYNNTKYNRSVLGLTVAPTLRCNFQCAYCYEQPGEGEERRDGLHSLMPDQIQQALLQLIEKKLPSIKVLSIYWYGGEPLLGKDVIFGLSEKIINMAKACGVKYVAKIVTNGYLVAEEPALAAKLKECQINSCQLTLDGPPEIHNQRRGLKGGGGTFDKVLQAVRLLREQGIKVIIRVNLDHTNKDKLDELLDILADSKLQDVLVYPGLVRAEGTVFKAFQSSCMTMEEFDTVSESFYGSLSQREFKLNQPAYPTRPTCGANCVNSYVVDPDGDLYKCWEEIGRKEFSVGNLLQAPDKVRRMREIRYLTWQAFDFPKCLACKALPLCMAGCSYRAIFVNANQPDCITEKHIEQAVKQRFRAEKSKQAGEVASNTTMTF